MNINKSITNESNVPQEKTDGRWMKRLVRILYWMLFNGGISALAWYAVNGNAGAERLLHVIVWINAIAAFFANMSDEVKATIVAKGRAVPVCVSCGLVAMQICFLVWNAWFLAAFALLIYEIAEAAIFYKSNNLNHAH